MRNLTKEDRLTKVGKVLWQTNVRLPRTCKYNTKTLLEKHELAKNAPGYYYRNENRDIDEFYKQKNIARNVRAVKINATINIPAPKKSEINLLNLFNFLFRFVLYPSIITHPSNLSRKINKKQVRGSEEIPHLLPTSLITPHKIYSQYLSYPMDRHYT